MKAEKIEKVKSMIKECIERAEKSKRKIDFEFFRGKAQGASQALELLGLLP